MAGAPNPARIQCVAIGSLTHSGTTPATSSVADILAAPCKLIRVFYQVTTAVTVAASATTLKWRPTIGSDTGAVPLLVWSQPIQAINTTGVVNANFNNDTAGTVIGAGGPTSAFGLGGSRRFTGESDLIFGPGGEIHIVSAGSSTAGAVAYWLEVELLGLANEALVTNPVVVVPTTVGAA